MKIEATGGEDQLDGPVSIRLAGPFQAQEGGKLPKFELEAAFEGAGQSIKAGATSTGEKGYLSFQGIELRRRRPGLPAVQGRLRGGPEAGRRREPELRVARDGPAQVAHRPEDRGRRQGRRRRHDQDHRRHRHGQAARRRQQRARQGVLARPRRRRPGAGEADRGAEAPGDRGRQGPARRDLHRQGRPDPAPDGRQPRRGRQDRARPPARSSSTSRSRTSTRTRRSPSRATPSRSASCSGSSAASGIGGGAREQRQRQLRRRAAAGAGSSEDLEKFSKCVTEAGDDAAKAQKCAELLNG